MKKGLLSVVLAVSSAAMIVGCNLGSEPMSLKVGALKINLSSQTEALAKTLGLPTVAGSADHIWLTITEVQLHTSGGKGWQTAATPNAKFDFLALVNGVTAPLNLYPLPADHYTQIRLLLAETNTVEIGGVEYPLTIPSGTQTGIKLVRQFTIEENEETEICIEFDLTKAVKDLDGSYKMGPAYKTDKCDGQADYPPSEEIPPEETPL
jgi:hypothetical protein